MTALHDLAAAAGLSRIWRDAKGVEQVVADTTLATILAALGYPAHDAGAIGESLAALHADAGQPPVFLSVDIDTPLTLPDVLRHAVEAELELETGSVRTLAIADGVLPGITEPGYHRLRLGGHALTFAVAPPRCVTPDDLGGEASRRLWGPAIQIPSLHDRASAYGDFEDLRVAVLRFAGLGADAVAISPVHAPLPGSCETFSPYSPSSRLFLNPSLAGGVEPGDGGALIDWRASLPGHAAALRQAFAALTPSERAKVATWAREQGPALQRHAVYNALASHLDASDWRNWPAEWRDPESQAVASFAAEHAEEIAFHLYAQWHADRALAVVQQEARSAGMAIGLIADLAVGNDPGGSDAWSLQGSMLSGLTIGAPPDPLGPHGQNWGLTGFSPQGLRRTGFALWIATLRAALRHAGGVRIDHAFGLARLWVVPAGSAASEGAYLAYPFADMLRILALESHRAGAIVVGEDLGTRPPDFVEPVSHRGILGMHVLWFERSADGAFSGADAFAPEAVAMTGTHDTATVAGWWTGRDLDWNRRLQRGGDWQQAQEQRMTDRTALWTALGAGTPQPSPAQPAPVVEAALAHLGATPSALAIVPLEDLLGLEEQPNLPGTINEHPNWRRRLSGPLAYLLAEPATARRIAALVEARSAGPRLS